MTKQKGLKRIVRSRMEKTGESYTTARSHLLGNSHLENPATPESPDYATLAGMSDATIKAKTGCDWNRWVAHLDYVGAASMSHRDIARHVHDKFHIPGWWAQTVTVGYERIKGLREIGQRRSGTFEASKSRTFHVPVEILFEHCRDGRKRRKWLPEKGLKVRTATAPRSIRFTWADGTSVQLWFTSKGENRSSVAVQHSGLDSRERSDALKQFWHERLDALGSIL